MAITRKEEARALNTEQRELVEKSYHPAVQALSDAELAKLVRQMREQRDKSQTDARRRRREMIGKAAPKGAKPSAQDAGSQTKLAVLAMAVRRLNAEAERRRQIAAKLTLVESAGRALKMKQAAAKGADFNTRTAHTGMREVANQKRKSLVRPMELGRQRKAGAVAQAKRDAR
ncbi:MAG: hypothetical protein WBA42_03730 [Mesorhizobium sp.]